MDLLRDPRVAELDWPTLEILARVVNRVSGTEVIAERELQGTWHPRGLNHFHWEIEAARRDYPRETERLEATLDDWRRRLSSFAEGR